LFCLILSCFGEALLSQNNFFIRFSVYNKVSINTKNSNHIITCADGSQIFYYAEFKNALPNVIKRRFGLTIGYNFKKIIFEAGLLMEDNRFSANVVYHSRTAPIGYPNNSYNILTRSETSGVSNIRYPLRVYYNFNKQQANQPMYIFIGLDVLTPIFANWGQAPVWDAWSGAIVTPYSNERIPYQFSPQHKNRVTMAPSLGFMLKLKTKRGLQICNLHLDWHFDGFAPMGSHKATFTGNQGTSYTINNKLSAQGIIFKLSKDIYPKRFKRHKAIT
jgi:hypothetical protein